MGQMTGKLYVTQREKERERGRRKRENVNGRDNSIKNNLKFSMKYGRAVSMQKSYNKKERERGRRGRESK